MKARVLLGSVILCLGLTSSALAQVHISDNSGSGGPDGAITDRSCATIDPTSEEISAVGSPWPLPW